MASLTIERALYHHCQDTGTNCGRTCAQMIISSFVQSPFPWSGGTAPGAGTPVPVTQGTLQQREPQPSDTVNSPQWYTHPDEMLILMRDAPEYTVPFDWDWRLANRATPDELLAEVMASLARGMPSIININGWDHWVVVVGAETDAADQLVTLRMRDPLPHDPRNHTYIDGCNAPNNGESYGAPWDLDAGELGDYSLELGTVPPPRGLTDYSGRCVGIVHGPSVNANVLKTFR